MNAGALAVKNNPYRNRACFWWLVFIFIAAQVLKLIFVAPAPELGGDAAQKWSVARDMAHGSVDIFRSSDFINHHYLRWGGWLLSSGLIWIFSDHLLFYYLSTFVPAVIAAVIFFALFDKYFGTAVAAIAALFWMFDPDLNRATFQLLPTGAGLLPLALIMLSFQRAIDRRLRDTALAVLSALLHFWLYGAKETNIFFAPGLFAAVWFIAGWRSAGLFAAVGIGLYLLEWMVLQSMMGSPLVGGRLLALLFEDSGHLEGMKSNPVLVAQQASLWDAGIISRWYSVSIFHLPIYIPAILCAFAVLATGGLHAPSLELRSMAIAFSMLLLSFVIFTSLFIVSLDPLVLGQAIVRRYLWILLPLAAFVLIFSLQRTAPSWASGHARPIAVLGAVAAVFGLALVTISGEDTDGAVEKAQRLLTFEISQPTAPLTAWQAYYTAYDPIYASDSCETDAENFNELKFGLMYVPEAAGGAERRTAYNSCLKTRATP